MDFHPNFQMFRIRLPWVSGALSLALLLTMHKAWAWPPTFSSELNFGNDQLSEEFQERAKVSLNHAKEPSPAVIEKARQLRDEVLRRCSDCTSVPIAGKLNFEEYIITGPDGWGFKISTDPAVVEVQLHPSTADTFKRNAARLQHVLFDAVKVIGLESNKGGPDGLNGSRAHLNLGFHSAFEGDPKRFIRFFADYANRPELGLGILGFEFDSNALPLNHHDSDRQRAFSKIVQRVNAGEYRDAQQVAQDIQARIYAPRSKSETKNSANHNQAIGLKYVARGSTERVDAPAEIRSIFQPRNAREHALSIELMEARLEYLKTQSGDVHYVIQPMRDYWGKLFGNPYPRLLAQYYVYIREMGEDPNRFRSLLTTDLRKELRNHLGDARAVFEGKIDWDNRYQRKLFETSLPDLIGVSTWAEARMERVLLDPMTPESVRTAVVDALRRLADRDRGNARIVGSFVAELSEKMKSSPHRLKTETWESLAAELLSDRPRSSDPSDGHIKKCSIQFARIALPEPLGITELPEEPSPRKRKRK